MQWDFDGEEVISRMTNREVLQHWRLLPLSLELSVRRLKRAQGWASNPRHHCQVLAAIFGVMQLEEQLEVNFKRVKDDLKLNKNSTPWATQFVEDLRLLQHTEACDEL